jgi:hypothetical protein
MLSTPPARKTSPSPQVMAWADEMIALILAQFPGELAVADIHGINLFGPRLQQTIGKAAGGRAQIHGGLARDRELKMLEGVFEFVAAATDVFLRRGERELIRGGDGIARFPGGVAVDERLAGHDGALGLFAAFTNAAIDQGLINPNHARSVAGTTGKITRRSGTCQRAVAFPDDYRVGAVYRRACTS